MDNKENILDELTNFEKRKPKEIPQILEDYLIRIAKTGDTMFPWTKLKPLFMFKMERVISEFHENSPTDDLIPCPNMERFKFDAMKEKLLEAIDNFSSSAPFTIQRLCELITSPRKHYKHTEKFMRGLEKNVLVVSTVEPGCSHIFACDCARKRNDHQNSALMNGILDTHNGVDNENNNGEFISKEMSILPQTDMNSDYPETGQQNHELKPISEDEKTEIDDVEMKSTNLNGNQEPMDTSPSEEDEALLPDEVDEPFAAANVDAPLIAEVNTPVSTEAMTPVLADTMTPVSAEVVPPVSAEAMAPVSSEVMTSVSSEVETPASTEVMTSTPTETATPVSSEVTMKVDSVIEMDATESTEGAASLQTEEEGEGDVGEAAVSEPNVKEEDVDDVDVKTAKEIEKEPAISVGDEEVQDKGSCNSDNTVSSSTHSPSSSSVTTTAATAGEAASAPVVEESSREACNTEVTTGEKDTAREAGGDADHTKVEKVDDGIDSSSVDSQPLSPIDEAKSEASFREEPAESSESVHCDIGERQDVESATSSNNDTDTVRTEVTGSDQQVEKCEESTVQIKPSDTEQPSSSDVNDENKISASSELSVVPVATKEEEESMVTTSPTEEATSTPEQPSGDGVIAAPRLEEATSAEGSSSLPLQAESSSSSSSSSPSTSSLSPQHISTTEAEGQSNEASVANASPANEPSQPCSAEVAVDESEPMEQD